MIIDDGWQSVDNPDKDQWHRQWIDLEADPNKFPGGLRALSTEIRGRHPQIKHIAVWHSLVGYWNRVSLYRSIAQKYSSRTIPKAPVFTDVDRFNIVDTKNIGRMYDDFYNFLSSSGIDAVKPMHNT